MSTGAPPFGALQAPNNPMNVTCYGQALLDAGLCQIVQTNGVGLVTRGFLWVGGEIWFDKEAQDGITTSWTDSDTLSSTPVSSSGLVGLYRSSKSYGVFSIPNSTIVETDTGEQFTFNSFSSFTDDNVTTWVITGAFSASPGDVYADQNGTHFTVTGSSSGFLFTDGPSAPYGMGTYLSSRGGTLTKVSGSGDSTLSYSAVANTDFYILANAVSVIPGTASNISSQNTITTIVSDLADSSVVILDSNAMTGGDGTGWAPSSAFGMSEFEMSF